MCVAADYFDMQHFLERLRQERSFSVINYSPIFLSFALPASPQLNLPASIFMQRTIFQQSVYEQWTFNFAVCLC